MCIAITPIGPAAEERARGKAAFTEDKLSTNLKF
jgi:hypothetical protein